MSDAGAGALDVAMRAAALDVEASALVETLPALPPDRLAAMAASAGALASVLDGEAAALASTLGRLATLYREGRVVYEGWALVASAAHTLARAVGGAGTGHGAALAAARYELETLLPRTGAPAPVAASPDVPLASLRRRT
jgi:hypothetical protein